MPFLAKPSADKSFPLLSSSDVSGRLQRLPWPPEYLFRAAKRALRLALLVPMVLMPISQGSIIVVSAQQPQGRSATVRGKVVDARSGEPIAKVKIIVNGSAQSTTTDENGVFTLTVAPGEVSLYVTTVGYGLVKKTITTKETDNAEVLIVLNQEAATLTERVTVTAEPFAVSETNAASEQTLNKTELQDLSKVIVSDPIRAVQSLPGVAANDDLRAEFAVRGADYRRVGLFLDGILTDNFLHLASGNADERITISVINTDTVNEVSLLSGALPAKYGDATAGVLLLTTRDGNRLKPAFRFSTGLQLGTSGVADGPLANKRGSWLIAARSSVLDYVSRAIGKISDDNETETGSVDFSDVESKVIFDLSARHRIGVGGHFSGLRFKESAVPNQQNPNAIFSARSRNFLANAFWDFTPNSRLLVQTRVFGTRTNFKSKNGTSLILNDESRSQFGARSDFNFLIRPAHRIEGGVYLRSLSMKQFANFFTFPLPGTQVNLASFDQSTTEEGSYLQDTYTNQRLGLSLTGGLRIDHSGLTGQTLVSPRAAMALKFGEGWTVRAGFGRHYQFPDFEPLFGQLGNPNLRAEQATHYNLSVERTFGRRYRALVEIYDREDRNLVFNLFEPQLQSNPITFPQLPFRNSLSGHARGIELTFQRRSANRLSGWVTYSYARTRYQESPSGLSFAGDFDQRHTFSAYGSYRFTHTFNVSGQWRYGSGFPLPGFFRLQGPDMFLAGERNLLRLPSYSRVDVRANKAFLFEKWKLTLSAELLNVTNHKNFRLPVIDGINPITGRVFHHFGEPMPVLPAVGVTIEF